MTEILTAHHMLGLVIGLCTFLIIGLFHPIVIKCHYYFGTGCRWWFLVAGVAGIAGAIAVTDPFLSALLGVFAFSSLWSIGEIKEQEKRVARGWFPENPARAKKQKQQQEGIN